MTVELDFTDIPTVECDKNRIIQVFDNLYTNAVKYSPSGSKITIRLLSENYQGIKTARVDINDEGPGISGEEQKKLFGEYQKLSTKPTGGESRTGLGLSIVKKIINTHGGKILVESETGKGTTMTFLLPLTH